MLTVNELFSGIGSQSAALDRLGIDFKVVGVAEIDKYAIKSYEAIHGATRNYGDISIIKKLDYADFWTYSFCCQDISVAGKQAGIIKGVTRSGLLYEIERLLEVSKQYNELPKYLMLENVKNLVGKQFKQQFDEWVQKLEELGFNTYWKVLNAKNYGIPQNRERVFAISIRKDIDTGYEFPKPFDNGKRLKDILELVVDEKFYVSEKMISGFLKHNINHKAKGTGFIWEPTDTEKCAKTLRANAALCPTNNTIRIPQATKQGYINCKVPGVADLSFPDSKTRRGRVQENGEICPTITCGSQSICSIELPCIGASRGRNLENPSDRTPGNTTEQRMELNKNGTSNTITTVQKDNYVIEPQFRIRKLTPLECWRLMGFTDGQFHKAERVNSNSQLYKQAGNSIVVDVLYYIFKNLFINKPTTKAIHIDNTDQLQGKISLFDTNLI